MADTKVIELQEKDDFTGVPVAIAATATAEDPKPQNPADDELVAETLMEDATSKHWGASCFYFMFVFSVWLVEILIHCNTPAYIFTISNCNRDSAYFYRLPLYANYPGNSSNSDWYFEDWHFIPNLGLCPSYPQPNKAKYLPHFSAVAPSASVPVSPVRQLEESVEIDETSERNLRASGGGGGGRGGSRSSSRSSSRSRSSSGSKNKKVYYYGTGGGYAATSGLGGASAVSYTGCISFGRKKGSQTVDKNGPDVWAAIDAANADPNYNAGLKLGVVSSHFAHGAESMLKVDSVMVLGTVVAGIGYPVASFLLCSDGGSEAMLFLEALIQMGTAAVAVAIINYLPNNYFIGSDSTIQYTKTIFPTCTVKVTDGPLFTMYLYIVIVSGVLFTMFVLAELNYHCCTSPNMRAKRPEERSDFLTYTRYTKAGKVKPFCIKCRSRLVMLEVDPYLAIKQHTICDQCSEEGIYRRDGKGYHCSVCPANNSYDLCARCIDEHYEEEQHDDPEKDPLADQPAPASAGIFASDDAPTPSAPRRASASLADSHALVGKVIIAKIFKKEGASVPTSEPVTDGGVPLNRG